MPGPNAHLRLILAVKADGLPPELGGTQFRPMAQNETIEALQQAGLWLGPRSVLEGTEEYRQIIPYIVLQHGSRFIRYTRTPASGEVRLHGRVSIGLGGHIDVPDLKARGDEIDLLATLETAAERELLEELGGVKCDHKEWVGVLVESDSAVGRVHIGVIGLWSLSSLPTGAAEDAIGSVSCCTLDELWRDVERLERWSAMLLPMLSDPHLHARAA